MAVQVYRPAIHVTLIKLVARRPGDARRYTSANREIDLTPYLGEGGSVHVVKGITEPAGGFTLALPDQPRIPGGDSFYAFIEPMDMIEIRAAREPHLYAGAKLPLIMRGFVSQVRRSESIGPDGEPQRQVTVAGQDSGKLWQINQFFSEALYAGINDPYLDTFRLQASTGLELSYQPVAEFIRDLTTRVINKRIEELSAFARRQGRPMRADADAVLRSFRVDATVAEGIVAAGQISMFQGPYWGLAEQVADRPWNELFIEDEEDGPVLRFRPTPYRTTAGAYIMPGATDPGTIEMDIAAVPSLDWTRSDSRVANFFWVPPASSMLDSSREVTIATLASGTPFDLAHPNNARELYGLRKMQVGSALLPESLANQPALLPAGQQAAAVQTILRWHERRMEQLKAMNRDNSALEEGDATVRGHEDLKPGRYLRLTRGKLTSESYITRVVHAFTPLQTWTTSLVLERGTGFLDRNRYEGDPFFADGREGPYSQ